ncbi:hypothetical protein C8A01DRAFT_48807 [Parachaetomium inaequale]|uniref:Synaptobrevin n=1 Tax=Parachaetomium inaequale TaxID=2588326 RepID=A0AAN6SP57_9PEZI|nr:hypothetical protein C8A01DRAFT_48807 [Parachaetomium inaequale]
MARLIPGVTATPIPRRADPLTDLTLLLGRLQRTILHADAEREARLREGEFEREKARANINYARSLLTKLEQEALAVKIHARRQEAQADLVRKREVLDQLSERLSDLAEFAAAGNNGDGVDEDTSDGEDILADIIATPSESMDSIRSPDMPPDESNEPSDQIPGPLEPPSHPPSQPESQNNTTPQPTHPPTTTAPPPTTTTSQALRPRHPDPTPSSTQPPPRATTTATSLFSTHPSQKQNPPSTTTAISATEEAILDHQRAAQDALSESILKLASELKASSHAFSASLDEDKAVVDRAGQGMSKTGQNMEGVARKMGMLQRVTEGEGWWGRLRLYVIVYGLMVVLVVVVFLGPKLRF